MKIVVSNINEFPFYPDIANNLELSKEDQFCIVFKKINNAIDQSKWVSVDENDKIVVDKVARIKNHVVKLVNPPILEKTSDVAVRGSEEVTTATVEIEMTLDDILSDTYPELFNLADQIMVEIGKLNDVDVEDVKK